MAQYIIFDIKHITIQGPYSFMAVAYLWVHTLDLTNIGFKSGMAREMEVVSISKY